MDTPPTKSLLEESRGILSLTRVVFAIFVAAGMFCLFFSIFGPKESSEIAMRGAELTLGGGTLLKFMSRFAEGRRY